MSGVPEGAVLTHVEVEDDEIGALLAAMPGATTPFLNADGTKALALAETQTAKAKMANTLVFMVPGWLR